VDRLMIEVYGIQLLQMMENAGRNLAVFASGILANPSDPIVIFCGNGHNGGGGLTAARHLTNRGFHLLVLLTGDERKMKSTTADQLKILEKLNIPIYRDQQNFKIPAHTGLIIDAMIGYGLIDIISGKYKSLIKVINEMKNIPVLSLDAPTGFDTTSGIPQEHCIRADYTLTLAYPKKGFALPESGSFIGDLYLADIGVPFQIFDQLKIPANNTLFKNSPIVQIQQPVRPLI